MPRGEPLARQRAGRPQNKLSPARSVVTRRIRHLFDLAHDGNLREASEATGVPYTTIRDLYHGRSTSPSLQTLGLIANSYRSRPTWFLLEEEGDALPNPAWVVAVTAPEGWAKKPKSFPTQWRYERKVLIPFAAWRFHRLMNTLSSYLMSLPPAADRPIVGDAETEEELDLRLAGFLLSPLLEAHKAGEIDAIYFQMGGAGEKEGSREEYEALVGTLKQLGGVWEGTLKKLLQQARIAPNALSQRKM